MRPDAAVGLPPGSEAPPARRGSEAQSPPVDPDPVAASPGGPSPFAGRAEELEPILGQFLLDPVDGEPPEATGGLVVEPLGGGVLEDPEEPAVVEVPDVPLVPVPVVDPLVAA